MASGSFAMAPTAIAGTPLARKPMPGPEPSAKSIESATIACCNRASPPNPVASTSRSYFAQIPFSLPTSIGANANVVAEALPTRTRSAAVAEVAPAAVIANTRLASSVRIGRQIGRVASAIGFAQLPDELLESERVTLAGVEGPDALVELCTHAADFVDERQQAAPDLLLIGLRQSRQLGDRLFQHLDHVGSVAYRQRWWSWSPTGARGRT